MRNEKLKQITTSQTFKLFVVVLLAFFAAITFRRSAGIIAMTPLSLFCCLVAAFIGIGTVMKCTVFGLTAFTVNTLENDDINVTIIFTALCLLAVLVASICARVIKKGKKYGYAILVLGIAMCILLNVYFVGNPIKAFGAQKQISDYTSARYVSAENAYLGNFEYSSIYYRHDTKAYYIDAKSDKFPTEIGAITSNGDNLTDGFLPLMEEKLAEPYLLEMKALFRETYPDDSFSVNFDGFALLPDENPYSASKGELYSNLKYEIILGGVQTAEEMRERITDYVNLLDSSGFEYAHLTFKCGIGIWQRRYVTVDSYHAKNDFDIEIKYVNRYVSNEFDRYIDNIIFDELCKPSV